LKSLKDQKIVSILVSLLKNRRNDLFQDSAATFEQALRAIWCLAFDKECKAEFIKEGLLDLLKDFKIGDHIGTKNALDGVQWTLSEHAIPQSNSALSKQASGRHVMISYSWTQQERMIELGNFLKSQGITIWIDVEQMEGSVLEAMAEAVQNASVVIIGLSSQYKESQACRTEAEYAYKLRKEMVFVMAEDGYEPTQWLGALLGINIWYSCWNKDGKVNEKGHEIVKKIAKIQESKSGNLASASSPSVSTASTPGTPVRGINEPLKTPLSAASAPNISGYFSKIDKSTFNYESVKLPGNIDTKMSKEEMASDKIPNWGVEEVARWLKSQNIFGDFLKPFVFHKITGKGLVALAQPGELGTFLQLMDAFQIKVNSGLVLDLYYCIVCLFSTSPFSGGKSAIVKWDTDQVQKWLEGVDLSDVAKLAKKGKFDGKIIAALHLAIHDQGFREDCKELGIKEVQTVLRFKFEISRLFS